MTSTRVKRSPGKLLAPFLAACLTFPTSAVELILKGGSLTLHSRNESLENVLRAFTDYGVEVFVQSGVEATVNGSLRDTPVEEALERMLDGFSYMTHWNSFPYGESEVHMLKRIDVYLSGNQGAPRQALPPADRRLRSLPSGARYVADELLLGVAPGTTVASFELVLSQIGGQVIEINRELGIYRIRLPANSDVPAIRNRLEALPEIAAAEPNLVYELPRPPGTQAAGPDSPSRPVTSAGRPSIAILDSGLAPAWSEADFVQATFNAEQPGEAISDPVGHGTHMALIGSGRITPQGVSPEAEGAHIIAIQAFDAEGIATNFRMLDSIAFAQAQGAGIASMSWGTYEHSQFLELAISRAAESGMLLLAAAGNDGKDGSMYPAAYPSVLAIGATTAAGDLWEKSNHGTQVDLAAPGTATFPGDSAAGSWQSASGTSISTPWVATIVSRYLEQYPEATPEDLRRTLLNSLSPIPGQGRLRQLDEAARGRFLASPP